MFPLNLFPKMFFSFSDDAGGGGGGAGDNGDEGGQGGQGGQGGSGAGDQGGKGDWKAGIAEEFRTAPELAKYKDVNDLVKGHLNQAKLVGKDKLVLPKDEKDKAAWDQVFSKLGRPEDPKGYKLPEIKDLNPALVADTAPETVENFLKFAHSIGLSNSQASALYEWRMKELNAAYNQTAENVQKSAQDAETDLRRDLGAAYAERVAIAKRMFQAFSSDKDKEFFEKHGNDPRLIRFLANVGSKLSEDALGPGIGKGSIPSPQEAQAEIDRIMGDLEGPYFNADHPEHDAMVAKVGNLYKALK